MATAAVRNAGRRHAAQRRVAPRRGEKRILDMKYPRSPRTHRRVGSCQGTTPKSRDRSEERERERRACALRRHVSEPLVLVEFVQARLRVGRARAAPERAEALVAVRDEPRQEVDARGREARAHVGRQRQVLPPFDDLATGRRLTRKAPFDSFSLFSASIFGVFHTTWNLTETWPTLKFETERCFNSFPQGAPLETSSGSLLRAFESATRGILKRRRRRRRACSPRGTRT